MGVVDTGSRAVLVVDDQQTVRRIVGDVLRGAGYRVIEAEDGAAGLRAIEAHRPDAVIADMLMPGMDGYHFLRHLRSQNGVSDTPVVLYTGTYESAELLDVARAWGRVWALTKPAPPETILSTVAEAMSPSPAPEAVDADAVDARYAELVNRKLFSAREEAVTDALTELPNRRALMETFERLLAGAIRHNRPISVVLVDIDHFKAVNDEHGHQAGDRVLTALGAYLRRVARASDFVGRYGGEEFMMLLPETPLAGARVVAERIRTGVSGLDCGITGGITASLGCAAFPGQGMNSEALVRAADAALYEAKAAGRDRVEVARLLR